MCLSDVCMFIMKCGVCGIICMLPVPAITVPIHSKNINDRYEGENPSSDCRDDAKDLKDMESLATNTVS